MRERLPDGEGQWLEAGVRGGFGVKVMARELRVERADVGAAVCGVV